MTINDLVEGLVEGLTMDNFHTPQVETVEIHIPKIPVWVKCLFVTVMVFLIILIVRHYNKLAESKKRLAEIERLRLINEEIEAINTKRKKQLDRYGLKD
jgi:hypothetical protein